LTWKRLLKEGDNKKGGRMREEMKEKCEKG
jgi:hypothetical protein